MNSTQKITVYMAVARVCEEAVLTNQGHSIRQGGLSAPSVRTGTKKMVAFGLVSAGAGQFAAYVAGIAIGAAIMVVATCSRRAPTPSPRISRVRPLRNARFSLDDDFPREEWR